MPVYLHESEAWTFIWPLLLWSLGMGLLALFLRDRLAGYVTVAAFSMLGLAAGFLTGLSRAPVVGDTLPAALSLVGGIAVFLSAKQEQARILIGLSVFGLAISLMMGTFWGSVSRESYLSAERSDEAIRAAIRREALEFQMRHELGLPQPSDRGGQAGSLKRAPDK